MHQREYSMTLTSTLIFTHKNPARDNVEHISKHAGLAITSYPKQFSFKKGRIKSISSLFSSFSIGSRRTYSSKEKSVLHFKVVSSACFSWVPEKWTADCYTTEKRYSVHARWLHKTTLTRIIYSSEEHKYLQSTSSIEYHLLNACYTSIFICNFDLHYTFFSQVLHLNFLWMVSL